MNRRALLAILAVALVVGAGGAPVGQAVVQAAGSGPGPVKMVQSAVYDHRSVHITGKGFAPSASVTIRFRSAPPGAAKPIVGTIDTGGVCVREPGQYCHLAATTGSDGTLDVKVFTPYGMDGNVLLDVQDHVLHTSTPPVLVAVFALPTIPIEYDQTPLAGSVDRIGVDNARAGDTVTFSLDRASHVIGYAKASATGRALFDYHVPKTARGQHAIIANDYGILRNGCSTIIVHTAASDPGEYSEAGCSA